jgi:hypothetical protein
MRAVLVGPGYSTTVQKRSLVIPSKSSNRIRFTCNLHAGGQLYVMSHVSSPRAPAHDSNSTATHSRHKSASSDQSLTEGAAAQQQQQQQQNTSLVDSTQLLFPRVQNLILCPTSSFPDSHCPPLPVSPRRYCRIPCPNLRQGSIRAQSRSRRGCLCLFLHPGDARASSKTLHTSTANNNTIQGNRTVCVPTHR